MSSYPLWPQLTRAFSLKQSEQTIDPTLRDNMDNGMETTRARFTRSRRTFNVALDLLTGTDKLTIDNFKNITVNFGALPFLLCDPRNAENPQTYIVRFATMPKFVDANWIAEDDQGNAAQYRYNCSFSVREI
jgi:hypothetical protein